MSLSCTFSIAGRALALAGACVGGLACGVDDPTDASAVSESLDVSGDTASAITPQGQLVGRVVGSTAVFKGVRYAVAGRWQPPSQPPASTAAIDASAFGSPCMQLQSGAVIGSEDCLFANVWAPIWRWPGEQLPVYVFIHGGAYVEGTASDAGIGGDNLYDGRALAERERVIVVTLNYRLGLAGFFSHAAQASDPSAGSYGLLDQIAALSWVRANIAAFGGDPAHVTVAGESAGSESVCNLLVSPAAEPLIAGAIMESAPCNAGTRAQRDLLGASIASAAGCAGAADPMACLRAKPLDQLLRTLTDGGGTVDGSDLTKGPIAGTPELPEAPWHALHAGRHAKVPVLIGSNEWEVPPLAVSVDTIVAAARPFGLDITAEDVETVVASYLALRPDLTRDEALAAVATDAVFTCPARRIADSLAGEHARPAYRYQFAHGPSLLGIEAPAIHGMELLYVFGAYKGLPAFTIGPVDDAVAAQIDDAFGNFARSGAPPWWQFWGPADPTVDNAFVFDGWWSSQRNAIATADCQILAPWLDQLMPL